MLLACLPELVFQALLLAFAHVLVLVESWTEQVVRRMEERVERASLGKRNTTNTCLRK